jgi:3-hydroxyisobutyrate dehydrogenase
MTEQGSSRRLGWLGTGRMGTVLATRLLRAGCDVAVYNRTSAKAQPLADLGAEVVGSAADLADHDIVFATVGTSQDLTDAVLGPGGLAAGSASPSILVDCSTISADASRQIPAEDLLVAETGGDAP